MAVSGPPDTRSNTQLKLGCVLLCCLHVEGRVEILAVNVLGPLRFFFVWEGGWGGFWGVGRDFSLFG